MSEDLSMSMFVNSTEYWKARCEVLEYKNAALKEENKRLNARVAELEKDIKRVIETYDACMTAQGIENYAKALCTFIESVEALKEPANEG